MCSPISSFSLSPFAFCRVSWWITLCAKCRGVKSLFGLKAVGKVKFLAWTHNWISSEWFLRIIKVQKQKDRHICIIFLLVASLTADLWDHLRADTTLIIISILWSTFPPWLVETAFLINLIRISLRCQLIWQGSKKNVHTHERYSTGPNFGHFWLFDLCFGQV